VTHPTRRGEPACSPRADTQVCPYVTVIPKDPGYFSLPTIRSTYNASAVTKGFSFFVLLPPQVTGE